MIGTGKTLLNVKLFVRISQFVKFGQHLDKFWMNTIDIYSIHPKLGLIDHEAKFTTVLLNKE